MDCEENSGVEACASVENVNKNIPDIKNVNCDQDAEMTSSFLTASDLCLVRATVCKSKDEDLELYKGPKMYYPSENPFSPEITEGILDGHKKSLELQRVVKNRDCVKAKWNEELKVAIVPFLKGKPSQHMGVNLKGSCALSPQEALFLLEKGLIEIEYNDISLSVEEAYALVLKGKLSVEKYEVYSFLSQQGFLVVHHQSRIGPSYEQLINLEKKKSRKRKAADVNSDLEQKRLTFTGVLSSNSEINSCNAIESNTISTSENTIDSVKDPSTSQDTLKYDKNVVDSTCADGKLKSEALTTITPDSSNRIESDAIEKNVNDETKLQVNKNNNEVSLKDEMHNKMSSNSTLNDNQKHNSVELEEMILESTNEGNEIDVENFNDDDDDDTNIVIIEDVQKLNKRDDINVDESLCGYSDNFLSDGSTYGGSDEQSLDVYSFSPVDHRNILEELNSDSDNLHSGPSKELDDEVTLVEVKKKEKKPLAVIDLLSDEENSGDGPVKRGSKSSDILTDEQKDKANGGAMDEDSDDEIQVLKVCPVQTNNKQAPSNNVNCIKSESKKLKIPINSVNIKSSFKSQMKFPDLCRTDIMCLPRPPANLLPNHVQPGKEAYVLNHKVPQTKKGRLWNSFKDMQEFQRERRRERQDRHLNFMNSRPGSSMRDFRSQNSFMNQMPPYISPDTSRDFGFDRNQNFPMQPEINSSPHLPINSDRNVALLPRPNVFNPPNHMSFANLHNLQSLSSSNPVAFVNEIQKTVFSVASSMISSMFGQHLNSNAPPARSSPAFNEPMMGFNSHPQYNNFSQSPSPFQMSGIQSPMIPGERFPPIRHDFPPVRFPPNHSFPGDQYPPFVPENNWRPMQSFRPRNFPPHKGPLFPCTYRDVRKKRDWNDVKAAVVGSNASDSGSDIEEVPINLNQFLWCNDIQPLVKPGSKLPVSEVLKSLQITQKANLCDKKCLIERYMPATTTIEISFDVYLPNSKYRRSAPSVPNYRIIVLRAADCVPRYSELVNLKRKWNDEASLQIAVVDHGDISFYSFSSLNVPEIIPFES